MVFSSLLFTFFFLPAVMLVYFLAKDKFRNYILLAASLTFYAGICAGHDCIDFH